MGVTGLLRYIQNNPQTREKVQLRQFASKHLVRTNSQPELLCDFYVVLVWLLSSYDYALIKKGQLSPYSLLYGGAVKEYRKRVLSFVEAMKSLGLKIVFCVEGSPCTGDQFESYTEEYQKKIYESTDILQVCASNQEMTQVRWSLKEGVASDILFMLKSSKDVQIIYCKEKITHEVISYLRCNKHACGILSSDTNYAIASGCGLFLIDSFGLDVHQPNAVLLTFGAEQDLSCEVVWSTWLADSLELSVPQQLADLAILVGNDYTWMYNDRFQLLAELGIDGTSIAQVAKWLISKQNIALSSNSDMVRFINKHQGYKGVMDLSYQMYLKNELKCGSKSELESLPSGSFLSPQMVSVVNGQYWRPVLLEPDILSHPCFCDVTVLIRAFVYALMGITSVTEFGRITAKSNSVTQIPVQVSCAVEGGSELLCSFRDMSKNARLSILYHCVMYPRVLMEELHLKQILSDAAEKVRELDESIPSCAVLLVSSLFFMKRASLRLKPSPNIVVCELDALLATMLCSLVGLPLFSIPDLPPPKAVTLTSYFSHLLDQIYWLASCLGLSSDLPPPGDLFSAHQYVPFHLASYLCEQPSPRTISPQLQQVHTLYQDIWELGPVLELRAELLKESTPCLLGVVGLFKSSIAALTPIGKMLQGIPSLNELTNNRVSTPFVDSDSERSGFALDLDDSCLSASESMTNTLGGVELSSTQECNVTEEDIYFSSQSLGPFEVEVVMSESSSSEEHVVDSGIPDDESNGLSPEEFAINVDSFSSVPLDNMAARSAVDGSDPVVVNKKSASKHKTSQQLPIMEHRDKILELIQNYTVVCIEGETGCGKSTKVPQFILDEALDKGMENCRILVTQPRRVAAIKLAERVAAERGERVGKTVGYCVGGAHHQAPETKLTYCTIGYLLQVLVHNPAAIQWYSHIILDEIHERSTDTDFSLLVVRKLVSEIEGVTIIVMSATMQGDLMVKYFEEQFHFSKVSAPYFVGAKCYPVQTYFIDELVALTESSTSQHWHKKQALSSSSLIAIVTSQPLKNSIGTTPTVTDLTTSVCTHVIISQCKLGESVLVFMPGIATITKYYETLDEYFTEQGLAKHFRIFILHSQVPLEDQRDAFEDPPPDMIHVILATNIAESSITLPKLRMVVNFGIYHQLQYDTKKRISCLRKKWCSQASCCQRVGRAGRVCDGIAIHLFTKQFYEVILPAFDQPEILNAPLAKLVLQAKMIGKRLGISSPSELLCLAIEHPSLEQMEVALSDLAQLGAIASEKGEVVNEEADITLFGYFSLSLPVDLSLCRLVLFSVFFGIPLEGITIAASLSLYQDVFSLPSRAVLKSDAVFFEQLKRSTEARASFDGGHYSDAVMVCNMFHHWIEFRNANSNTSRSKHTLIRTFCHSNSVRYERLLQLETSISLIADRVSTYLPRNHRMHAELLSLVSLSEHGNTPSNMGSDRRRRRQFLHANVHMCEDATLIKALVAAAFPHQLMLGCKEVCSTVPRIKKRAKKFVEMMQLSHLNPAETLVMYGLPKPNLPSLFHLASTLIPHRQCNVMLNGDIGFISLMPRFGTNPSTSLMIKQANERGENLCGGRNAAESCVWDPFMMEKSVISEKLPPELLYLWQFCERKPLWSHVCATEQFTRPHHPLTVCWTRVTKEGENAQPLNWRQPSCLLVETDERVEGKFIGVAATMQGMEYQMRVSVRDLTLLPNMGSCCSGLLLLLAFQPLFTPISFTVDHKTDSIVGMKIRNQTVAFNLSQSLTRDDLVRINALRKSISVVFSSFGEDKTLFPMEQVSKIHSLLSCVLNRTPKNLASGKVEETKNKCWLLVDSVEYETKSEAESVYDEFEVPSLTSFSYYPQMMCDFLKDVNIRDIPEGELQASGLFSSENEYPVSMVFSFGRARQLKQVADFKLSPYAKTFHPLSYCLREKSNEKTNLTPVESVSAPVGDVLAPVESASTLVEDISAPVDDIPAPVEGELEDVSAPVESNPSPVGYISTPVEEDVSASVESISVPEDDLSAPVEVVSAPAESVSAPRDDLLAPVEGDVSAPVESISAPRDDLSAPVEGDVSAPVESISAPRDDLSAPVESISAPRDDLSAPVESVSAPRDDLSVPVEEDVSAPVESVSAPRDELSAPVEEDVSAQVESVSAPRDDLSAPVEGDVPALVEGDIPSQVESVSAPRDDLLAPEEDVPAPVESVSAPRDDLSAPVEEDVPAQVESVLAPKDDLSAPVESVSAPRDDLSAPVEGDVPAQAESISAPVEGVLAPVESSSTLTEAPVCDTVAPVLWDVITAPVESVSVYISAPGESIPAPGSDISAPVEVKGDVSSPVKSVSAPVKNVSAPGDSISAPVEVKGDISSPVKSVSAPMKNVSAPGDNISAPVEVKGDVSAPVNSVSSPVKSISAPVKNVSAPGDNISAPVESEVSPPVSAQEKSAAAPPDHTSGPAVKNNPAVKKRNKRQARKKASHKYGGGCPRAGPTQKFLEQFSATKFGKEPAGDVSLHASYSDGKPHPSPRMPLIEPLSRYAPPTCVTPAACVLLKEGTRQLSRLSSGKPRNREQRLSASFTMQYSARYQHPPWISNQFCASIEISPSLIYSSLDPVPSVNTNYIPPAGSIWRTRAGSPGGLKRSPPNPKAVKNQPPLHVKHGISDAAVMSYLCHYLNIVGGSCLLTTLCKEVYHYFLNFCRIPFTRADTLSPLYFTTDAHAKWFALSESTSGTVVMYKGSSRSSESSKAAPVECVKPVVAMDEGTPARSGESSENAPVECSPSAKPTVAMDEGALIMDGSSCVKADSKTSENAPVECSPSAKPTVAMDEGTPALDGSSSVKADNKTSENAPTVDDSSCVKADNKTSENAPTVDDSSCVKADNKTSEKAPVSAVAMDEGTLAMDDSSCVEADNKTSENAPTVDDSSCIKADCNTSENAPTVDDSSCVKADNKTSEGAPTVDGSSCVKADGNTSENAPTVDDSSCVKVDNKTSESVPTVDDSSCVKADNKTSENAPVSAVAMDEGTLAMDDSSCVEADNKTSESALTVDDSSCVKADNKTSESAPTVDGSSCVKADNKTSESALTVDDSSCVKADNKTSESAPTVDDFSCVKADNKTSESAPTVDGSSFVKTDNKTSENAPTVDDSSCVEADSNTSESAPTVDDSSCVKADSNTSESTLTVDDSSCVKAGSNTSESTPTVDDSSCVKAGSNTSESTPTVDDSSCVKAGSNTSESTPTVDYSSCVKADSNTSENACSPSAKPTVAMDEGTLAVIGSGCVLSVSSGESSENASVECSPSAKSTVAKDEGTPAVDGSSFVKDLLFDSETSENAPVECSRSAKPDEGMDGSSCIKGLLSKAPGESSEFGASLPSSEAVSLRRVTAPCAECSKLKDEDNLLSCIAKDEGDLLSCIAKDEGNLLSCTVKDEDDLLSCIAKDEGNLLSCTAKDEDDLLSCIAKDEGNLLSCTAKDEGDLLSCIVKDEGNFLSCTAKNEDDLLSCIAKDEGNLLSCTAKDEDDLLSCIAKDEGNLSCAAKDEASLEAPQACMLPQTSMSFNTWPEFVSEGSEQASLGTGESRIPIVKVCASCKRNVHSADPTNQKKVFDQVTAATGETKESCAESEHLWLKDSLKASQAASSKDGKGGVEEVSRPSSAPIYLKCDLEHKLSKSKSLPSMELYVPPNVRTRKTSTLAAKNPIEKKSTGDGRTEVKEKSLEGASLSAFPCPEKATHQNLNIRPYGPDFSKSKYTHHFIEFCQNLLTSGSKYCSGLIGLYKREYVVPFYIKLRFFREYPDYFVCHSKNGSLIVSLGRSRISHRKSVRARAASRTQRTHHSPAGGGRKGKSRKGPKGGRKGQKDYSCADGHAGGEKGQLPHAYDGKGHSGGRKDKRTHSPNTECRKDERGHLPVDRDCRGHLDSHGQSNSAVDEEGEGDSKGTKTQHERKKKSSTSFDDDCWQECEGDSKGTKTQCERSERKKKLSTSFDDDCWQEGEGDSRRSKTQHERSERKKKSSTYFDDDCWQECEGDSKGSKMQRERSERKKKSSTSFDDDCWQECEGGNKGSKTQHERSERKKKSSTSFDDGCWQEGEGDSKGTKTQHKKSARKKMSSTASFDDNCRQEADSRGTKTQRKKSLRRNSTHQDSTSTP